MNSNNFGLVIFSIQIYFINCDSYDTFNVDINDILNENLMPVNMLLIDGPFKNTSKLGAERRTLDDNDEDDDGTFGTAFSTMGFHRKMINEYLCTNFVAEQIMSDQNSFISTKLERRIGNADIDDKHLNQNSIGNRINEKNSKMKDNMLYDQGSSGYQNWLSKTTTLEDIYRHYSVKPTESVVNGSIGQKRNFEYGSNSDTEDDYEEGEITGYAVQQQPTTRNFVKPLIFPTRPSLIGLKGGQFDSFADFSIPATQHAVAGNKNGHADYGYAGGNYGGGGGGYGVEEYVYDDKSMSKEMGLKDIFEIALTTLAFLSFGMFVLHVLMCITMTKTDNNLTLMPMEEVDIDEVDVAEVRRRRRAIPKDSPPSLKQINEITRKVLRSIEAVLVAQKDNGKCLHRSICENNKYSRTTTKNGHNIWIPVWGLGMSWLSSRMISTHAPMSSILESLKASAMGLGGADCSIMYSECNLEIQIDERKLIRKRRELEKYELKMDYM